MDCVVYDNDDFQTFLDMNIHWISDSETAMSLLEDGEVYLAEDKSKFEITLSQWAEDDYGSVEERGWAIVYAPGKIIHIMTDLMSRCEIFREGFSVAMQSK